MAESNIQELLNAILNTKLGKDMRQAIHDGIKQCYDDVSNPDLNVEAFETAVQNKIDSGELAKMTIPDGSITEEKLDPILNDAIDTIIEDIDNLKNEMIDKLDKNQGSDNVGKVLFVGEDGIIMPGSIQSMTEDVKQALLNIINHIWYTDENSKDYIKDFYNTLYPPKDLVSISATFDQKITVYNTDSLDVLRENLTVTAIYPDKNESVTKYYLSGSLNIGVSKITVTYGGKDTTFDVNVTENTQYVPDLPSVSVVQGYYYDSNGSEVADDDGALEREYLEVLPNTEYYWTRFLALNGYSNQICEYDEFKSFISRSVATFKGPICTKFTTSNRTHYIRLSWFVTNNDNRAGIIKKEDVAKNISICLAYKDDSRVVSIPDLSNKLSVYRNGIPISIDWEFKLGVFDFNAGQDHTSASSSDSRIYNSKSVILLDGDVLKFDNNVKYGITLKFGENNTVKHTEWITDESDYVIGGL